MLAYKRIPHRVIRLLPGPHPVLVRLAGFRRWTVPALDLGSRKVQGTMAIARALEELAPDPPLFPADRSQRARVEAAERWGEAELQPLPRRIFRFALLRDRTLRRWMAEEVYGLPAPRAAAVLALPMVRALAGVVRAEEAQVRDDVRTLPLVLDRVDELMAEGTIGGPAPNAADFQILSSVRVMLEFSSLAHQVEGRPAAAAARRLFPRWTSPPVPATTGLPA